MRICFVAESFHPRGGGIGTFGLALAEELVERGAAVTVLTRREDRSLRREESVNGVAIRRLLPAGFARFGKVLVLPGLFGALCARARSHDVVYVFGARVVGLAATAARIVTRTPTVLRFDVSGEVRGDFLPEGRGEGLRARAVRTTSGTFLRLRDRLYRGADAFVAISDEIRTEILRSRLDPVGEKTRLIHNGVDVDAFRPAPDPGARRELRRRIGLPEEAPVAVFTGRLDPEKRVDLLLEAWDDVLRQLPDARLLVVGGDGGYRGRSHELRGLASRLGLRDAVTFTGRIDDVRDHLRASDLFVLPSDREGFSVSALEAMSCGLPVVATATSGMRRLVADGRTGALVPIGDREALSRSLRRLLAASGERRELGEAARERVVRHFSLGEVASSHLALFERLQTSSSLSS